MITDMMQAATKASVGYMQSGEPSPVLEYVMHPKAFMDLLKLSDSEQSRLLYQRMDGRWEFMNHVIREDSGQDGWKLQPATT